MEVIELPEDGLGEEWSFAFDDLGLGQGFIQTKDKHHQFSELSGAFVRFDPQPALPPGLSLSAEERSAFVIERRAALEYLLTCVPFEVANRPHSGRSNGSKLHQMLSLADAGFKVPRWLLINEEYRARKFARGCRTGNVYKSCSGLRSRVRLLDEHVFETLRDGTAPIVVQEYIEGREVRIHVVKGRNFATEVISDEIDYRFHGETSEYQPIVAPGPIQQLCFRWAASEDLTIAGFDFRVTNDGSWYCLEVNPVPSYLPYEMATGQPIGNAVVDSLAGE